MTLHLLKLLLITIQITVITSNSLHEYLDDICPLKWELGIDFEKFYDSKQLPILGMPWSNDKSNLSKSINNIIDANKMQKIGNIYHGNRYDYIYEIDALYKGVTKSTDLDYNIGCYHVCMSMAKKKILFTHPITMKLCPSPCHIPFRKSRNLQCQRSVLSTGKCLPVDTFIFKHNYQCECTDKAEWDRISMRCVRKNPCQSKLNYPCHREGTEICIYDEETLYHICVCKPNYMGDNCSLRFDPCKHNSRGKSQMIFASVAGNRACNVNNGNKCKVITMVNGKTVYKYYKCICDESNWLANASIPFDNCLFKVKLCQTKVCVHGVCLSSPSGAQGMCQCKHGYSGDQCLHYRGSWSSWSPWDRCRPACGNDRWRVRTRECTSAESNDKVTSSIGYESAEKKSLGRIDCLGSSTDWLQCPNRLCAHAEENILVKIFHFRYLIFVASIFVNVLMSLIMAFIWRLFFRGLLRRQFEIFISLVSKYIFTNVAVNNDMKDEQ